MPVVKIGLMKDRARLPNFDAAEAAGSALEREWDSAVSRNICNADIGTLPRGCSTQHPLYNMLRRAADGLSAV
jgi:hypothetical protein